jgi:transcriptional regulator with XRE-family HTH domain
MKDSRLLLARRRRNLTQMEVAAACGLTQSFYGKIETREASPSPETAEKIARFFGHEVTEMQLLYPERYETATAEV